MKKFLPSLFFAAALALVLAARAQSEEPPPEASVHAVALEPVLMAPTLWDTPASQFVTANQALGFHWLSSVHAAAQSALKGGTFLGMPVCQAAIRCEGEKITQVDVQIYDRGDVGELQKADYEALVQKAAGAISAATGVRFVPRGRDASNAVKADGLTWTTARSIYLLEYSCTRAPFRAEFVRLQITPKPKSMLAASFAASAKEQRVFRGADHVTRDAAGGDVFIKDVPMVDQGRKGYCVVAACERLFRYYGIDADANEMAQLADTSASGGTSLRAITDSLKRLTARLKIHFRTLYEIRFPEMIADYDKAARKAKEGPLNTQVASLNALYLQIKPDILRASRNARRGELDSFKRNIKTNIDAGKPLLWSVILGVLPDGSPAKTPGGHTRLIIGYNEKTGELVYSDTWGPGHEFKRMPLADGWAITMHLDLVEPF